MRVLVTGHDGYIGPIMIRVLREAGHSVVGLDTYLFEDCILGRDHRDIEAVRKDVRDITPRDLEGFDAIVHLAALSNDPLGELKEEWTLDINHRGSIRLAQVAKEAGVQRFLYSSSCSIYGAAGPAMRTETAPLAPLTHYAVSKVRAEQDLARLADAAFSPVFLRNATAYGVSPKLRVDLVLNNLVGWAVATGKVRILSDGTPWRPIVHIEDISLAFAAALVAPREVIHNQAFNVGSDEENYQVRDLAEIVVETVSGCAIEYAGGGGPDPRSYRVDFGKLKRLLPGFAPRWNARRGARELCVAYQSAGLTEGALTGRKYVRLKQLKHLLDGGRLDGTLRWKQA